ncbi:tRNA pseudouridine(13) synthase TruD [Candidatus Woesearchaeota archaeon]|nr:tRNA pseudouridine(13) synthase TruD [Candidatus Woesearchaeota archaeon]
MYIIKKNPEDFIVKERSIVQPKDEGNYSYFILKKKDWTTIGALEKIAGFLRIPLKSFGFAGTKDKAAVTEQVISIRVGYEKKLEKFRHKGIRLEFIGRSDEPVSLGDLEGNEFQITVRDADNIPNKLDRFINYFGEQRFSSSNAEIGRAMIKDDFRKAAQLADEPAVRAYLKDHPKNYAGALKQLPKKILMMYVHSYQSFIWNRTVKEFLEGKKPEEIRETKNFSIPLVGFGTDYQSNRIEAIIKDILKKENVTERDFIIRKMPELSSEGGEREVFADVKDMKIEKKGVMTYKISFFLPKGCYATELIRQMFE